MNTRLYACIELWARAACLVPSGTTCSEMGRDESCQSKVPNIAGL